jgi:hypothetical protein
VDGGIVARWRFGMEAAIGIGLMILSAVIIAGIIRTVSNNLNVRA